MGRKITTIEAIEADDVGRRVVAAWVDHQVPQCGYCQSGQVMAATSLLKQTPHPTDEQIAAAMVNLCRCGTYNAISAAVHDLAGGHTGRVAATGLSAPTHRPGKDAAAATIALPGNGALGGVIEPKTSRTASDGRYES